MSERVTVTCRACLSEITNGTRYDGHGGYYAMGETALAGRDMSGPRRPSQQRAAEMYDDAELRRFRTLAAERNAARDGDTAAFYLRR